VLDLSQADSVFSGISTFGRLPYLPCLSSDQIKYDIAFIGRVDRGPRTGRLIYPLVLSLTVVG
jgi:hypothetical protein